MNKILVLMSTYNGELFIEQQIRSILDQDYNGQINLIIRDDCSNDRTCDIVGILQNEYDGRICLIPGKENIGANNSYMYLIRTTYKILRCNDNILDQKDEYKYIAFSDQDDVWLDGKIKAAVQHLGKNNGPTLYASTSIVVDQELRKIGQTRKKNRELTLNNTIIQNICPGHTIVMNRSMFDVLNEHVRYDSLYVWDMWIVNHAVLYGEIVFDNNPHTLYRQHRSNEMGYGRGWIGRICSSVQRGCRGDGVALRKQMAAFLRENERSLEEQHYLSGIKGFIEQKNWLQRVVFSIKSDLHRQSRLETVLFWIGYIVGVI